jgi:hypothetical protein
MYTNEIGRFKKCVISKKWSKKPWTGIQNSLGSLVFTKVFLIKAPFWVQCCDVELQIAEWKVAGRHFVEF